MTSTSTRKRSTAPKGLGASGRKLWASVSDEFELDEHERALLVELCRITDRLDLLHAEIDRDGVLVDGLHGAKVNPALAEARQQAIAAARIAAALRLPDGDEDAGSGSYGRRQRRVGFRGPYGIRGAV